MLQGQRTAKTNHEHYRGHHFLSRANAGGWWAEVFRDGSFLAVTPGLKRSKVEADQAARLLINALGVERVAGTYRYTVRWAYRGWPAGTCERFVWESGDLLSREDATLEALDRIERQEGGQNSPVVLLGLTVERDGVVCGFAQ